MDVTKVKAAINAAKNEVQALVSSTVKAAEKDTSVIGGIAPLVKANVALDKALEKIEDAVERTAPKEKKDKSDKKTK